MCTNIGQQKAEWHDSQQTSQFISHVASNLNIQGSDFSRDDMVLVLHVLCILDFSFQLKSLGLSKVHDILLRMFWKPSSSSWLLSLAEISWTFWKFFNFSMRLSLEVFHSCSVSVLCSAKIWELSEVLDFHLNLWTSLFSRKISETIWGSLFRLNLWYFWGS